MANRTDRARGETVQRRPWLGRFFPSRPGGATRLKIRPKMPLALGVTEGFATSFLLGRVIRLYRSLPTLVFVRKIRVFASPSRLALTHCRGHSPGEGTRPVHTSPRQLDRPPSGCRPTRPWAPRTPCRRTGGFGSIMRERVDYFTSRCQQVSSQVMSRLNNYLYTNLGRVVSILCASVGLPSRSTAGQLGLLERQDAHSALPICLPHWERIGRAEVREGPCLRLVTDPNGGDP